MRILSDYLSHLEEYVNHKGLPTTLEQCELIKEEHNTNTYVSSEDYLNALSKVISSADDKYFGLHFGFYLNLAALGSVYEISMHTNNIGQAIELWKGYSLDNFPLVTFKTHQQDGKFIFELHSTIQDETTRAHVLDAALVFIFREIAIMTNGAHVVARFSTSDLSEYKKWFTTPIQQGENALVFDAEILNEEINTNRKTEIEYKLPTFLTLLNKSKDGYGTFSSQVRNMVLNMCNPELPTLKQVARQFLISERSFQRALAKENMSFRSITNNIKEEVHTYLCMNKNIKAKDLAFLLGYSSTSSMIQAVKSWD